MMGLHEGKVAKVSGAGRNWDCTFTIILCLYKVCLRRRKTLLRDASGSQVGSAKFLAPGCPCPTPRKGNRISVTLESPAGYDARYRLYPLAFVQHNTPRSLCIGLHLLRPFTSKQRIALIGEVNTAQSCQTRMDWNGSKRCLAWSRVGRKNQMLTL